MRKKFVLGLLTVLALSVNKVSAQWEAIVQEGEIGVSGGAAHYFGDLNTNGSLNRPKPAFGLFFRKQLGTYTALRASFHYAQLGYSDIYNKDNAYQRSRNLSFNTNIFEFALQGDFNFYKFLGGDPYSRFTPYITLGVGLFSYDPYAYLQGTKYFLRPLGTEGQGSSLYPDRKPYGSMSYCVPLGVGVKYALTDKFNIGFEIVHRFTGTDYLDDVSKTFVNPATFPALPDGTPSVASRLSDRSGEVGEPIGFVNGTERQRGFPRQKDQYIMAEVTFSFNITSYRCPTAK